MLLLPAVAVEAGGRAAWMVAVLAGVSGYLTVLVVGKLSQRFPDLTVTAYVERLTHPLLGRALGTLLGVVFGLNAAVDLRMALKSVMGVYFVLTPEWVLGIVLAATALAVGWHGIVRTARLGPLLAGILALTFLLTFPLMIHWIQPGHLIPLLDPTPLQPATRPFWVAMGAFRSGMFLAVLLPYVAQPRRAVRIFGWAYWAGWLGVLLAVVTPVLVFGPEGARSMPLPFPFVVSIIRLPTFPLERVEMVARMVYDLNIFYAVSTMYFCGGLLMAEAFGTRRVRPFMVAVAAISLLPLILINAELPAEVFAGWTIIGTLIMVWTVFPLLWLLCWLRGRQRAPVPARRLWRLGRRPAGAGGS